MKLKLEVIFEVPAWDPEMTAKLFNAVEGVFVEDEEIQKQFYHILKTSVEKLD